MSGINIEKNTFINKLVSYNFDAKIILLLYINSRMLLFLDI